MADRQEVTFTAYIKGENQPFDTSTPVDATEGASPVGTYAREGSWPYSSAVSWPVPLGETTEYNLTKQAIEYVVPMYPRDLASLSIPILEVQAWINSGAVTGNIVGTYLWPGSSLPNNIQFIDREVQALGSNFYQAYITGFSLMRGTSNPSGFSVTTPSYEGVAVTATSADGTVLVVEHSFADNSDTIFGYFTLSNIPVDTVIDVAVHFDPDIDNNYPGGTDWDTINIKTADGVLAAGVSSFQAMAMDFISVPVGVSTTAGISAGWRYNDIINGTDHGTGDYTIGLAWRITSTSLDDVFVLKYKLY